MGAVREDAYLGISSALVKVEDGCGLGPVILRLGQIHYQLVTSCVFSGVNTEEEEHRGRGTHVLYAGAIQYGSFSALSANFKMASRGSSSRVRSYVWSARMQHGSGKGGRLTKEVCFAMYCDSVDAKPSTRPCLPAE